MNSFWSGSVLMHDGTSDAIDNIQLFAGEHVPLIPPDSKLLHLSFVDCTRIPLHIICGPAYEVIGHRSWIHNTILDSFVLDENRRSHVDDCTTESPIGAIFRIEGNTARKRKDTVPITELLLYATLDNGSGNLDNGGSRVSLANPAQVYVRFHALPLSSHLLYESSKYGLPPTPPPEIDSTGIHGQFLQSPNSSGPKKRQRLNDIFDDATKPRKAPKRQDSHEYTQVTPSRSNSSVHIQGIPSQVPGPRVTDERRIHSRTQSLNSFHEDRPRSRGQALERARSSLSRVASSGILSRPGSRGPGTPVPDAQDSPTENKNKKTLSTIVMASMRMRGMSQRKRDTSTVEDSEYKLVYHNTFKAANFALRTRMDSEINPETVRDVVDLLLDLFCGDSGSESFDMSHTKIP